MALLEVYNGVTWGEFTTLSGGRELLFPLLAGKRLGLVEGMLKVITALSTD